MYILDGEKIMSVEAFTLNNHDLNKQTRRWSISALQLPNAKLERMEISGQLVSPENYNQHGSQIEFISTYDLPDEEKVTVAYIDVKASKTRFQLNAAIFAAALGFIGTIFTTAYPDIRCFFTECVESQKLVFMRSRSFGLNEGISNFHYTFGHKECKNAADIFPSDYLEKRRFWFALGLDDGLDVNKRDFSGGAKGPYTYSTGYRVNFDVSSTLKEQALETGKRIQLVTILADEDVDLGGPFKLGNLKGKARVVHLPGQSVK